ncbi:MAG: hypothetical protein PWQ59_2148 [Thermoanaerobacterium sp.]|nr:hypothetical protein [Thermoanaerobacterium sp.]
MMYNIIENDKFNHYYDVLTNKKYWDNNRFRVLNYEAGTGKTLKTYEFLGNMYREGYSHKVLYVQPFSKENRLLDSVRAINEQAGEQIAAFVDADTTKSGYKYAINAQVLCITHNMYKEICKGKHSNLMKDRGILIVDEFPNLFEQIIIDDNKLIDLLKFMKIDNNVKIVYDYIKQKQEELKIYKSKMRIMKFDDKNIYKILRHLHNIIHNREDKKFIKQFKLLFESTVIYEKEKFYTFDNKIWYKLLKNNIILDANGGFDYRYRINKVFKVDYQAKVFNYQNSIINYYKINTSKNALKSYDEFVQTVLNELKENSKSKDKHLIVTDIENEGKFNEEYIKNWYNIDNVKVDHFGNLLGKNDYRDFNKIWLFKTPNYAFVSYILQYIFYSQKKIDNRYSLEISNKGGYLHLRNNEFEKLRQSLLLGEYYQAIKRINRDNTKSSEINIFTNNDIVIDKIKNQFKGIDFITKQISVSPRNNNNTKRSKSQIKIEEYKRLIIEAKKNNIATIPKADICDKLGLEKTHLRRFLNKEEIIEFNNLYNIEVKHHVIINRDIAI